MKKIYLGSNLKMYKGIAETKKYLQELQEYTGDISRDEMELFIIPSFTTLKDAVECCESEKIRIGAQNMCWEEEGQFTGEVSPDMLEEIGVRLVMVGHSERRHIFGETDIEENKKVLKALDKGFQTLLCIGETAEEKNYNISEEVLAKQLKIGFHNVDSKEVDHIWVAYEPVWSIGVHGIPASAEYAERMHAAIKRVLKEIFGEAGEAIPVLYGGSVNRSNAEKLIEQPSIDGLFVGRAAWKAEEFDQMIRSVLDKMK